MVISITLLLSYIVVTQHILEPQTYRTEDTKIGLQYSIRELNSLLRRGLFVLWGGFCVVGRLGRKKKRARGARSSPARFLFFFLMGIPSGSLCGGERELKQQRRKERSKRRHLKREFALFQTFLVFKSSIERENRKFYVVVVHYDIKNA